MAPVLMTCLSVIRVNSPKMGKNKVNVSFTQFSSNGIVRTCYIPPGVWCYYFCLPRALTWGGLFFFINFLLLLAMTKEIAKRFFHPYFLKKIRLCSSHYDRWLVYLLLLPTFSYVAAVGHESNEQDKSFVEVSHPLHPFSPLVSFNHF